VKQALVTMLSMQDRINSRIHENWPAQNFAWYRAIWIECAELIEHYGYKWWKRQSPDMAQVRLEVIDIWHFGLSALFVPGVEIERIAEAVSLEVGGLEPVEGVDVREAAEALALHALESKTFSPARFWALMFAVGLDFDSLYSAYIGKNVLNFFRQDHGYQDGTYEKTWGQREDNEHLAELVSTMDESAGDFPDQIYHALERRYRELVRGP